MSHVHVLTNPAARSGTGDADRVVAAVTARGHSVDVIRASSAEASLSAARSVVEAGADRLVVVGGDGVVHLAIQAVAETETVLGIVPQGTGNDFARALGIPESVDEAIDRALAPATAVDAMHTTHGWVASVATLGFSGDVTDRANHLRWPKGAQRYTVATLLQLPRLRSVAATVVIDGERIAARTTMLSVGNTSYFGGGMEICPAASPTDGLLQTVVIGDVSRRVFARVFPRVFGGSHVNHPQVATYSSERVTIEGPSDVDLWADGERMGPLPVECRCVPAALRVAGVDV